MAMAVHALDKGLIVSLLCGIARLRSQPDADDAPPGQARTCTNSGAIAPAYRRTRCSPDRSSNRCCTQPCLSCAGLGRRSAHLEQCVLAAERIILGKFGKTLMGPRENQDTRPRRKTTAAREGQDHDQARAKAHLGPQGVLSGVFFSQAESQWRTYG